MTRTLRLLAYICLLWLAYYGCTQEQVYVLPHTELIFPHEEGRGRIMYVEDTAFTTAGIDAPQTNVFFQREIIGDTVSDQSGRALRRIEVSLSPVTEDSNYAFTLDRIWQQHFEPQESGTYYAERIEQNKRVLVLKFPVAENVAWNGNLFNNDDTQEFFYAHIDTAVTIRGKRYENCVMVIQEADTGGLIFDRFFYDIYAPNIGLVKRYRRSLVFDGTPPDEFNPSESFIQTQELVEAF